MGILVFIAGLRVRLLEIFRGIGVAGLAISALLLALCVQTLRLDGLHLNWSVGPITLPFLNFDGWKEIAAKAQATVAQVKADQPKAEAAQSDVNHQPAVISAVIASQSNAQAPDYLRRVAAASAAHAGAAGSLRGAKAVGSGPSQADLPGADHPAQSNDGQAGSADLVSVARADWDKLNREAALRVQLYQVGQAWIADGVAKEEEAPGDTEK